MSQELENIDKAIADLRDGKRVGRVTVNGKTIEYSDVTVDDLLKLRAQQVSGGRSRKIKVSNFRGGKDLC